MRGNELIMAGTIRPVVWRTMEFEQVPEAHQLMYENKHLGKISILVGAEDEDEGRNEPGPGAVRVA
jgi:crotonyl-CoA carboxylase/reductase